MSLLEPDRDQIEMFVGALFRHAGREGFVSVRAFYEDVPKPFRITPTQLTGGLPFLIEAAEDDARRAANDPKKVVFCPPIATFTNKDRAREVDLAEGLALSVELDQRPRKAIATLEAVLGPATVLVASGGKWTDPETGLAHDKLHAHWRLSEPARGAGLAKLKQARDHATRFVGGDPTNKPIVHPIRWPGSWHRKGEPRLCRIETLNPDCEIDLATALKALTAAAPVLAAEVPRAKNPNGKTPSSGWPEVRSIIDGTNLHGSITTMGMKLLAAGTSDAAAVNVLRALMTNSTADRDERWAARYSDIPRAVSTAREKVGVPLDEDKSSPDGLSVVGADEIEMRGIEWLWQGRFALGKLSLIAGLPDYGKGQIAAFLAAVTTNAILFPCGEGSAPQGNVIWFNAEDDTRDTVKPRLIAAGADPKKVHFVNGTHKGGTDRTFSLITDLPLLREAMKRIGNVVLIIIDPIGAYVGVGKVDGRSQTDVRGVLTPLKDLAEETNAAIVGVCHFNKKADITSAVLRVSDSVAYTAVPRSVHVTLDDPEDKSTKIFAKAKNNLAGDVKSLRYGFGVKTVGYDARLKKDIEAPFIVWHSQYVEMTANEVMQAAASGSPYAKREAREFLLDRLEGGPARADELFEEAAQHDIAKITLKRAKKELYIRSYKEKDKVGGGWLWELQAKKVKGVPE